MILQIDKRHRQEIQQWGCNLMTIEWFVNKYTNLPISPDFNNDLYEKLLLKGWIDQEIGIQDYVRIYKYLGLLVTYHDIYDKPDYVCLKNEFEHLHFVYGKKEHFTAGNGQGIVTYDSMGCARTVRYGTLKDKRIFRLIDREGC